MACVVIICLYGIHLSLILIVFLSLCFKANLAAKVSVSREYCVSVLAG
jgi:hypothetical protein